MQKNKKLLSVVLAVLMIAASVFTVFSASAYSYSFVEATDKAYTVCDGLEYSQYTLTSGENGHVETANAFEFSTDDYIPMVFSCFSGTSAVLKTQYEYATKKFGYEVAGIINGAFFSMDSGSNPTGTYGTLVGINISNGKISSAYAGYNGEVVAFTSDGKMHVLNSNISYDLTIAGKSADLYYINRTSGVNSNAVWYDKFYYYDESCGRVCDTSEYCLGYEILCEKVNNTELRLGGTLQGKVISVTENTYGGKLAETYYDRSNKFILFVKNGTKYASLVESLKEGDLVEIAANETITSSKEIMESANSVITNVGWLVKDGVDRTRIDSTIGTHSVTLCAQWTAFGTKEDGSYVFFTTSGGSTGDNGGSVTLRDVAKAMIEMGCTNVIRMDGGGSVAMYACDDGTGNPGYKKSSSREVGDCILIVKRSSILPTEEQTNKLNSLISAAEGELAKAEDDAIRAAYDLALSIKNDENSVGSDYTRAITELQSSMSGSAALIELLNSVLSLDRNDYTDAELDLIWDVYEKALAVKNDQKSTAKQMNEAYELLDAALNFSRNVCLGKSYETNGIYSSNGVVSYPDENGISLTDGKDASAPSYSDSAWVGFNKNMGATGSIVVDLGGSYNLNKFVLRVYDGHGNAGITAPATVKFYVSDDKQNWTNCGDGILPTSAAGCVSAFTLETADSFTGKYLKAEFTYVTNWGFISEIEAYSAVETRGTVGYITGFNKQIAAGDSVIFNPEYTPELTYEAANVKWSENLYCKFDETVNGYVVTKVEAPNGANGGKLAEGTICIGVHNAENGDSSTANRAYAATAKVGDVIEFHGIYVNTNEMLPGGFFKIVKSADFNTDYNGIREVETYDFEVEIKADDAKVGAENKIDFVITKVPETSSPISAIRLKVAFGKNVSFVTDGAKSVKFTTTLSGKLDDIVVLEDGYVDISFMDFEFGNEFKAGQTISLYYTVDGANAGDELGFELFASQFAVGYDMDIFMDGASSDATVKVAEEATEPDETKVQIYARAPEYAEKGNEITLEFILGNVPEELEGKICSLLFKAKVSAGVSIKMASGNEVASTNTFGGAEVTATYKNGVIEVLLANWDESKTGCFVKDGTLKLAFTVTGDEGDEVLFDVYDVQALSYEDLGSYIDGQAFDWTLTVGTKPEESSEEPSEPSSEPDESSEEPSEPSSEIEESSEEPIIPPTGDAGFIALGVVVALAVAGVVVCKKRK